MKQYIIIAILILASFAVGRYTVSSKTTTQFKEVQVEKINEEQKKNETTIKTETTKPDGTKVVVTTTKSNTDTTTNTSIKTKEDTKTVSTQGSKNSFILEGMASLDITNPSHLVYGVAASNNLIGPLRIGLFGFTDGKVGVSLGLQF